MKTLLKILLALFVIAIIGIVAIIVLVFYNSDKYVCKSKQGDITILYKNGRITGYKAINFNYNLEQQQEIAEKIGLEAYFEEFKTWFETNTSGTCEYEKK